MERDECFTEEGRGETEGEKRRGEGNIGRESEHD